MLSGRGAGFVVVEDAEERARAARERGFEVIEGNAATTEVLDRANVAGASTVIVAIPNAFEAGQAVELARKRNGGVPIIARAHSDEEESHLSHLGANVVIRGEREIALGLVEAIDDRVPRAAEPVAAMDILGEDLGEAPPGPQESVGPVDAPMVVVAGDGPARPRRRKPGAPANTPGAAFNPETAPREGE